MAESSMLSDATIQELKQILEEEYKRNVDLKETSEIAHTLVGYFDLLAKIYHQMKTQNDNDDENTNN